MCLFLRALPVNRLCECVHFHAAHAHVFTLWYMLRHFFLCLHLPLSCAQNPNMFKWMSFLPAFLLNNFHLSAIFFFYWPIIHLMFELRGKGIKELYKPQTTKLHVAIHRMCWEVSHLNYSCFLFVNVGPKCLAYIATRQKRKKNKMQRCWCCFATTEGNS